MKTCDDYRALLMGLLDQELTPEEAAQVNQHLVRCAGCRGEYEQLRETSAKIGLLSFVEPQEEVLRKLWRSPYHRFVRNTGLWLVIGGYVALLAYALYMLLLSPDEAAFPRIAAAAVIIGFFMLLLQAIRERIKTYKSDPYKEIER